MSLPVNPLDWTDADWETLELSDPGDPPCPDCGAADSFVTVKAPTRADRREAYRCVVCEHVVEYGRAP